MGVDDGELLRDIIVLCTYIIIILKRKNSFVSEETVNERGRGKETDRKR